jgi:hypothetical protein
MSEYERLKKQRDAIIRDRNRKTAERIADRLLTDRTSIRPSSKLVLDCGCYWEREALIETIQNVLSNKGGQ